MSGKPIDYHFRILGLQRGCSEEDLKKAYRKKALEYHPDRNPHGADAFKQINTAYEELGKHFKQNGGKDGRSTTGASAGSAYQYARTSSTSFDGMFFNTEPSSSLPRDNAMWSQFYRAAAAAAANSRERDNMSGRKGEDAGKSGPSTDARWRQAHGSRVPVSGYSSGGSGTTHNPPPRTTADYMDKKFTVPLFTSTPKSYAELKFMFDQLYTKTEYVREGLPVATDDERESFEKMKDSKLQTMWSNLQKLRDDEEKRRTLRREWERTEEDLRERAETMKMEQEMLKSQRTKEEQRRAEMQAQRMKMNRAQEAARKQREERERKEKQAQAKGAAAASAAAQKRRDSQEDQRDRMLDDKRRLLRKMLSVQYSPDSGEVGSMSDLEVYTLLNILRENVDRVEAVMDGRMAGGSCSRCTNAPKVAKSFAFQCTHACVCHNCGQVALRCPLCGAKALAPPTSSVEGSRRAPKTTPMKSSSPMRQRSVEKRDPVSPRMNSHRDASDKLSGSSRPPTASGSPLEASEISPRVNSRNGRKTSASTKTTNDHPPLFSQYYPQPRETSAFPSSPRNSESPTEPRRNSARRNSASPSRSRPHSRNHNESFSSAPTVGASFSAAVNGGREASIEIRSPRMTSVESQPSSPFIEKVETPSIPRDRAASPRERMSPTTQIPLSHAHKPSHSNVTTSHTSAASSPNPTPRVVSTPPPGPAPAAPRRSISSSEERNVAEVNSPKTTLPRKSSTSVTLLDDSEPAVSSKRAPSTSAPGVRSGGKAVPTPPPATSVSPPPRQAAGSPRPPRYAPASFLKEAEDDGTSLSASMLSSGEVTSAAVTASLPKPTSTKEAAAASTNIPRTTVNKTAAASPPKPTPSTSIPKIANPPPAGVKKAGIPPPLPPPRESRMGSLNKKGGSYSSDSQELRAAPPLQKTAAVHPITSREEAPPQNSRKVSAEVPSMSK